MKERIFNLLHTVAVASNEASTPDEAITTCIIEICKYTGWELGQAFSFLPERPGVLLVARGWSAAQPARYASFREATEATPVVWGADIPGRVLAKGESVRVSSLDELGNISRHRVAVALGLRSGIGFPVRLGKNVGAVLEFFSSEPIVDPEFIELVELLTPQLARVLERAKSERELISARELAIEASVAKSDFLAQMSHEIRTPINAVIGMSHLLLSTKLDGDQREYSEVIRESAQSLLSIVNDVLDISKIEAGKLDIQIADFQLDALLRDISFMLSYSARSKALEFVSTIEQEVPLMLRGDAGRMRQILVNLIGNAIKFTDVGKVSVCAKLQSQSDSRVNLLFEVEDTGAGIQPEIHSEIFETFNQVGPGSKRKYGGTGLGLSISRRLVEMMGGEIGFYSPESGRGSVFWFTVELQKTLRTVISQSPVRHDCNGSVLVVEDNEINQIVTLHVLKQKGFQVRAASSGVEALELLQSNNFDLVIMDCRMPRLDGYGTTRRIRKWEKESNRKPLPIVALTASAIAGDRERCLAAGMNDYLSKPVAPEVLVNRADYWIHLHRPSTSPSLLDGVKELLPKLMSLFKSQSPIKLSKMKVAIAEKNAQKLQHEAHSLKSSAGNLGLNEMREFCAALEKQASEGDFEGAEFVFGGLESAYSQACSKFDISKPTAL